VVFFVLAGWAEFLGVALRCRGRRLSESLVLFALRLAGLLLVAAAIEAGGGLRAVAWAQALSAVPAIALGALLLRGSRPGGPEAPTPPIPAILRVSAPLAVNGGLALVSLRVEFLVLRYLAGAREAGLFLAALRVVEFMNVVPSAITAGAMPALTREALGEGAAVRRRTAATMAFVAAPAAAGIAVVAPGLLGLLFGSDFTGAAASLRLLAAALLALFMNGLLGNALIAGGRAAWLPRLTAVRVAVALALALALVPTLGALGAAAGFLASELLLLALGTRACAGARFAIGVLDPLARALLLALPILALAPLAPGGLPGAVAVGVTVYALALGAAWLLRPALLRDLGPEVRYPGIGGR
jgi:O-antigen/teichoic acid export membrane protein